MPFPFHGESMCCLSRRVFTICMLLNGVIGSWVDPDTPSHAQTTTSFTPGDTRQYQLVSAPSYQSISFFWHHRWRILSLQKPMPTIVDISLSSLSLSLSLSLSPFNTYGYLRFSQMNSNKMEGLSRMVMIPAGRRSIRMIVSSSVFQPFCTSSISRVLMNCLYSFQLTLQCTQTQMQLCISTATKMQSHQMAYWILQQRRRTTCTKHTTKTRKSTMLIQNMYSPPWSKAGTSSVSRVV